MANGINYLILTCQMTASSSTSVAELRHTATSTQYDR